MIEIPFLFSTLLLATGTASIACVLYAAQGIYRPLLNKLWLAIGGSMLLWAFGLGQRVSAGSLAAARIGSVIAPIGYAPLFGYLLHYILLLTGHKKLLRRWWSYVPLYLPGAAAAVGLSLLPLFGVYPFVLRQTVFGWVNDTWNAWVWFYYAYYTVFITATVILLLRWGRRTHSARIRRQAILLLVSILLMAALGSATDALPGFLHVSLPGMAACFAILPILAISYAVRKLGFMHPAQADPDTFILKNASHVKSVYMALGICLIAAGFFSMPGISSLTGQAALPYSAAFGCVLLLGGCIILLLHRMTPDETLRELMLAFVFSLYIPFILFRFAPYGSITVWAFLFLLLLPSILFNRRILIVTVLLSSLGALLVLMGAPQRQRVPIGAREYALRCLLVTLAFILSLYAHHIYSRRLHENAGHAAAQTMLSETARILLQADLHNAKALFVRVLCRICGFFRFHRAYLAVFGDSPGEPVRFCEWAAGGESLVPEQTAQAQKAFLLRELGRRLDGRQILSLDQADGGPAMAGLGLMQAVLVPVRESGRNIGFLCFGAGRASRPRDGDGENLLRIAANLTAEALTKLGTMRKVQHIAYHDQLTGLPNRALFRDRLNRSIRSAAKKTIGVVFLDLDSFKSVNDTMGHELGDQLLIRMADAIAGCLAPDDTVARFGGDEFVLLLNHVESPGALTQIMECLMEILRRPVLLQEQESFITGSAGIALYPQDGQDAEALIANADIAMYQAKGMGKNRYAFCSKKMKDDLAQHVRTTNLLSRALARGQLLVYYQPQVSLAAHRIVGLEALLRWNLPGRGIVLPRTFIPIAEKTGLIHPIGKWVLETACRQGRLWLDRGCTPVRIAVNVSVQQLYHGDFAALVADILQKTGFPAELLELEVTESVANSGAPGISRIFTDLKAMGVTLSIDDFGTEYSSLNRLKRLPVDRLKLDMQFVQGIESSEKDRAITMTIISLAKSLHMQVVAEGVETCGELDFLSRRLCDEVQGFYCYRPMPAEEMEKHLLRAEDAPAD